MNGNTGPFIQYAHARINSLLLKAGEVNDFESGVLGSDEKEILRVLAQYPNVIKEAGKEYSPALLANYAFELVKAFNHYYQAVPMLIEKDKATRDLRLVLSKNVSKVIASALSLLGIQAPLKM